MTDLSRLHAWCALWRVPKVGAKRYANILKAFGSPEAFLALPDSERRRAGVAVDNDALDKAKRGADKDIRWLQDNADATILTRADPHYPPQLANIADPPPMLFCRGNVELLSEPQLAIVGSRSPSHEGVENAGNFARFMTQNGVVITSGLALGIDGAAHQGALSVKSSAAKSHELSGETIAVMGTGADSIYPAKHRELAYRIIERGVVITELPIGTPVMPQAFPRRNRMISGLSLGVLIVEAGLKSGSLITARTALEQNREVFAIPGSIHNPLARGCNHLIRNGAKLVETAKDIFEELQPALFAFIETEKPARLNNKHTAKAIVKPPVQQPLDFSGDVEQQRLWQALSYDPQPVDILAQRSGLAANQVSSMLLILELAGNVIKHPGGRYQKKGQ
ncbi:MAG: DNA-protecting protein DprA [Gammaproteobacteria bacterium]|nr:MAG: DNA-protecting protein DprA [Gammaproteobacteria bacterium]